MGVTALGILGAIAVCLLGVLAWGVFVFFKPYRPCTWCDGKGMRGKRRKRRCWRCKGKRDIRRIGAKQVHKLKLSLIQAWDERGDDQ